MNNILENTEKYILNEKMLFLVGAVILTMIAAATMPLPLNIEPLFAYLILLIGFLSVFFLIKNSIKNTIIPYSLLQMTSCWIFIGPAILQPFGLDVKPHIIVFFLSTLLTAYFIFKNFSYLWSFQLFRFTLIFCLINIVYALFYTSDFRNSNYIDVWIQNNTGLRFNAVGTGIENYSRQFGHGETQFLIYMTGLAPLVGTVISLMTFYGAKTKELVKERMLNVVKYVSVAFIIYLGSLLLSIAMGTSVISFIRGRLSINAQFTGDIIDSLFLILLIGYSIYLSMANDFPKKAFYKGILNISIIAQSLFIFLGVKKGTIISLGIALVVLFLTNAISIYKARKYAKQRSEKGNLVFKLLKLSPVVLVLLLLLGNSDLVNSTLYTISNRFADLETFNVRTTIWNDFTTYWMDNLNFFKALFGFGIDSSRELTFFISALYPDKSFQQPHPHNIFLEFFYNYGLMALLYFLPIAIIFIQDLKRVFLAADNRIRLLSGVSIAIILNFIIYFMAECPSMPVHLIFFCTLGLLESAKHSFDISDKEVNDARSGNTKE